MSRRVGVLAAGLLLALSLAAFLTRRALVGSSVRDGLGVEAGRLAPCPDSPNCVSSQADPADAEHYLAPLRFDRQAIAVAMAAVVAAVEAAPRTTLVTRRADYLHAEFRTRMLRFVDDVEFFVDAEAGLIHFRSASRLGRSDLGVNRKRIRDLLADIEQRLAQG